ncbi:MAG: BBP7 family outer membrane beta-barrel protein [Gemmataceae bacterium]
MLSTSRKLAAAAFLAAFAPPASAQMPPEAAPLGAPGAAFVGFQPDTAPMPMPGGPGLPMSGPATYEGPVLATDSLGSVRAAGSHGPRAWFGAEYLLYWTKDAPVPFAVATVGPANGSAVLGAAGTQVLYGNTAIDYSNFGGIRTHGGVWLTNNESFGLEGSFFFLPRKYSGTPQLAGSDLAPVLSRPFYNTATNTNAARIISKPGQFFGTVTTTAGLELWGAELGTVWRARDTGTWTLDTLAAFKFVSLDESLGITDGAATLAGGVSVLQGKAYSSPSVLSVSDTFQANNQFYGATLGLRSGLHWEGFTWTVTGKIGLGSMTSKLRTVGTSTVTGPNTPPITSAGGLYASGPNLGDFETTQFAAIPEIGTNINVQITSWLAVNLGYNYMCITDVVRPGDQITGQVNPSYVPTSPNFGTRLGPTGSTIPMTTTSFWTQGLQLGLTFGW